MIETTVKNYLDSVLEGIPVYLEVPKPMPEKFIVFQMIDGGVDDLINEVTFEFRSFANTKYDAALVDEALRDAMGLMNEGTDITCKIGGRNDDQDSVLKKYRYRCYYNLYY